MPAPSKPCSRKSARAPRSRSTSARTSTTSQPNSRAAWAALSADPPFVNTSSTTATRIPGFNPPSLDPAQPALPRAEFDSEERGVVYTRPIEVPISRGGEVEDEALSGKTKP